MRYIDLFCGIGGFHLAVDKLGYDHNECIFASDSDEKCREVYEANFGIAPAGDITDVPVDKIPPHDMIFAGFPCQPFSYAGDRQGFGDPRGTLFYEIIRIAKHHLPGAMVLENVRGLLTVDGGRTFRTMVKELNDAGYHVNWELINAADYGVPQVRKRLFIICRHKDSDWAYFTPKVDYAHVRVEDIMNRESKGLVVDERDIEFGATKVTNDMFIMGSIKGQKGKQYYRVYNSVGFGPTLTARNCKRQSNIFWVVWKRDGRHIIDSEYRYLDLDECRAYMGFPKSFKLHESERTARHQLGNAVVPNAVLPIIAEGLRLC